MFSHNKNAKDLAMDEDEECEDDDDDMEMDNSMGEETINKPSKQEDSK